MKNEVRPIDAMEYKKTAHKLRHRYLDSLGHEVLQNPKDVYNDCNQAATAITDLLIENQALRNAANWFKARWKELEAKNAALRKMQPVRLDGTGASAIALAAEASDLRQRLAVTEDDNKRLREAMKLNCLLCDSMHENGNCTAVGGFCTAVPAAHCPLIPELLARAEAAEARCATLEKMVKEYQEVIIPGYREQAEKAERERDAARRRGDNEADDKQ